MGSFDKKKVFGIGGILTGVAAIIAVVANLAQIIDTGRGVISDKTEKSRNTATTAVVETVKKTTKTTKAEQEDAIEISDVEQETEPPTEAQPAVTYLDSLKVAESNHYNEDESNAIDTIGNTYTSHVLSIGIVGYYSDEDTYAMYYLGGKYKTLSGTIAVNDKSRDNGKGEVSILCDDNVVYTTGAVSRATAPVEFSVNIENCQWLKIAEYSYNGYNGYDKNINFILSDWKLE